ncbi:histidine kinase [Emticicia aquatilis]|nr:histidine kinase [Emticicia aquatilis]
MNSFATHIKEINVEGIKNLQLLTFAGDIELIGTEENIIKIEIFASVRSWMTLFLNSERLDSIDSEINPVSIETIGETLHILSKPNYFHPYNWINFQKTSFRISLPKHILANTKTYGGNIYLKNLDSNHIFTTWGGKILINDSKGIFRGKTMGGNLEINNCDANIDAKTWGGKVLLSENDGDMVVKTLGGNIQIKNQKGKVHASTSGGNILGEGLKGELQCSTWGGNIKLYGIEGDIGANTKGGNIEAEVKAVNKYIWLDTAGGNISVALPLQQSLDLDISSSKVTVPLLSNFEGFKTQDQLVGKLNGGGPKVLVKGTGGNIKILPELQKFDKVKDSFIKRQSPSIDTNYVALSFGNFILGLFFCLLLTYGLSSIVYFTFQNIDTKINPQNALTNIEKIVFLSNIANGLSSHGAVTTFIQLLDKRIYQNWLKYLIIIAFTLILIEFSQILLGIFSLSYADLVAYNRDFKTPDGTFNVNRIYSLIPLIVSCSYFYYWQHTRQITRKISEQEYQLLNLEKLKTTAELGALQARINPHFLYNSLNSIASLVHSDPDKAEEMTILLSKFFRYTTDRNNEHFCSVSDELEVVKTYLSIEQVRFGDRLKFSTELDKSLEDFQIPRFLLQPLVENAIKHGIAKVSGEGKIEVKIYQKDESIILSVHDSGKPFPEEMASGYGLRSINEKLRLIYGKNAHLEIQNDKTYKAVIITIKKK